MIYLRVELGHIFIEIADHTERSARAFRDLPEHSVIIRIRTSIAAHTDNVDRDAGVAHRVDQVLGFCAAVFVMSVRERYDTLRTGLPQDILDRIEDRVVERGSPVRGVSGDLSLDRRTVR